MKKNKFVVTIEGISPLIMNNCARSNPLSILSKKLKEITSKRKKSDEDYQKILEIQWESSIYWDDEMGLFMPWENIFAALLKAARQHKLGPKMNAFTLSDPIGYKLNIPNGNNLQVLKNDEANKFVKMVSIQRSKTLSCRAIFKDWGLTFAFDADQNIISPNDVKSILFTMQSSGGFGDWRPSSPTPGPYGKFDIKKVVLTDHNGIIKNIGVEE